MNEITVSAPGKVHFIGEHAVVYNEPAIISAIGLRLKIAMQKYGKVKYVDTRWDDDAPDWELEDVFETTQRVKELWKLGSEKKDFTPLFNMVKADRFSGYRKAAVGLVMERLGIRGGVSLRISSDIPTGAGGVGSSSALAVCLASGMAELYEKNLTRDEINGIAFEVEKIIHGTPSGGDNTTCCFGGLIWFQKGQPNNTMISLKDEITEMPKGFVLLNTKGIKASTGELVQRVRNLDAAYRDPRIKEIGKLTYEMKVALKNKDYERMKDIVNRDQQLLAELGVSTQEIDDIASVVRRIGGAAKLCGAGGGGVMLCWSQNAEALKKTIQGIGYEPWQVELGVEGVRVEK
jgi:mevalonate kinase